MSERRDRRFYRPELDALRFFAFACVLLHHGPNTGPRFNLIRQAGGFGLSLFFLLSAFLITQLLLREREEWGTVHLRSFYTRRILRIWPLYFTALVLGIILGRIFPRVPVTNTAAVAFVFFISNWFPASGRGFCAPMWSISVEEQFYLIWPLITKFGGKVWVMAASLIFIAGAAITIGISYPRGYLLWYSTFVEFLFFGTGALLAVAFRGGAFRMAAVWRLLFIAGGLTVWILSVAIAPVANAAGRPMTRPGMFMAYTGADLGCILIFIAFLGASGVPKVLVYLGKISYGLYVFHAAMITLASWIVERALLGLPVPVFATVAAKDLLALLFSVALASVSYRFLEMPFLRVKERFAFVRSRPAESSFGNPEF